MAVVLYLHEAMAIVERIPLKTKKKLYLSPREKNNNPGFNSIWQKTEPNKAVPYPGGEILALFGNKIVCNTSTRVPLRTIRNPQRPPPPLLARAGRRDANV